MTGVRDQPGNALAAACTAASTSRARDRGTRSISSPVAGLKTGSDGAPSAGARHSFPIRLVITADSIVHDGRLSSHAGSRPWRELPPLAERLASVRLMSLEIARGAAALHPAASLVAGWGDTGVRPGAPLVVSRGGTVVAEGYWGFAELAGRRAAAPDTLWSIASITKPITAMTVMSSVRKGLIDLDAPISSALPEFGTENERGAVTLRHLLTHTSGLAGFSVDNLDLRRRHEPIEQFIASFLKEQLQFSP